MNNLRIFQCRFHRYFGNQICVLYKGCRILKATVCVCLDSIMNVYDESEKGKDRNYLYKNAERKKISNSKIIMVIGCGL